jgi:hypothetical protein
MHGAFAIQNGPALSVIVRAGGEPAAVVNLTPRVGLPGLITTREPLGRQNDLFARL